MVIHPLAKPGYGPGMCGFLGDNGAFVFEGREGETY